MVHPLRVVPQRPLCETAIEGGNIDEELPSMVVGILFLHGAVEPLAVGVLLGGLGSRFVVREVEGADGVSKVLLEL